MGKVLVTAGRKLRIGRPRRLVYKLTDEEIVEKYVDGMSSREIAELAGVPVASVQRVVRKAGVSRDAGELAKQRFGIGPDPTPEEIEQQAAEARRRRGGMWLQTVE